MADSEEHPVSDSTQASDTEQTSFSTSLSPNAKSPIKDTRDGGITKAPSSKLDTLPRENLLALLKKQAMASKESKKQIEEYREKIKGLEEKCQTLEEKLGNNSTNEMMTFELDDYKNSCAELKKQLENQKEAQKEKDELVRDLTQRNDLLMQEKAETNEKLKEAKALAAKLQKEIDEQHTILSENSKEAQSLTLQSQQIRAEYDLEIAKLNTQLKRFREESIEQQKYITDKTAEIRQLKNDFEALQQSYENLKIEHSTFKERAEYVLKQKNEEQSKDSAATASSTVSSSSSSGKMEIEELISVLNNRNERITQLTERSSYLEDELRSTQDYAKNIKGELEDAQHSLNQLRTRGLEERRRAESDYDFRELEDAQHSLNQLRTRGLEERRRAESDYDIRLRQAYTEKEILQKQLNRTIEQSTEEKEKLIESFQRQNAELEEKNRELLQTLEEYRNLAAAATSSTTPRATTPIRVTTRRPKFPQPINFLHEPSAIITSTTNMHPPGLDHENDEDDFRSLQDVINDATDDQTTITGPRPISAFDDLVSRPSIDFYTVDEYDALERQLSHTRELLNDMEDTNAKLVEQIKILKEEIRRLERNTEREEHTKNGEYLKNVLMKYLAPPKVNDERQQLLPVLTTMLRLSPEEVSAITGYIKESLVVSSEDNNGWTSYLWSNIV
uniref:GRIP domain-containing protein n=1 Tax=Panagrolaimus sp. PS1159 TaxID=55785 RepID=A0AC35F962_9BILA